MAEKRWTILIIPPGTGGTRTLHVGERTRRMLVGGLITVALLIVAAAGILFTPYATPSARLLASENERLRAQLQGIDTRIAALSDTLAAIGIRDQQIRLLAGLPGDSTADSSVASAVAATGSAGRALASVTPSSPAPAAQTASNGLPKPFLGRLGFGNRPDIEGLIKRATALSASFRAVNDTLTVNFERLANTPSIMPTTGWLSSHFTQSRFHPILHASRAHEGIDLSAPMGAPIIAPAAGRVISVTNEPGYGRTFEIDHGSGIITRFAHCSRIIVHVGQVVTRGQPIATIGNSGLSTGPHLHYEVHVNGKPVDPLRFVLPDKVTD
jgi:murein DD-endopeptidase MepM/ murein hydrolase activator NlpD